jgi:oligoendopeptidase F
MAAELRERKEMDPAFMWDLTSLYRDDEDWEAAFSQLSPRVDAVAAFEGKIAQTDHDGAAAAGCIRALLEAETELDLLLSDLFAYANLRRSEDTRAPQAQKMYARIYAKFVEAVTRTAFVQPQILSLSEETLRSAVEREELAPYRFAMEKLLRQKPHTLSEKEEALLARFGEVFAAPGQIADNLQDADMVFDPVRDSQGQEHELTGSNYILLQTSPDRTLRENAFRSFYRGYRQHINTFAATYAGAVKAAAAEAQVRGYASSRAMSMAGENIPVEVYDTLIETVRAHLPAMYGYEELRKKLLSLDELHYYDLYTPLTGSSGRQYTYEQAQQMVLEAVAPLGDSYSKIVREGFSSRWIDVYPNRGKSGGAFSSGTYHSNPYIMTNFTGTLDSVSTIAHEMGHSMHTWHSNHAQPPHYAEYTLFVAEVASTVNENLLVEYLLKTEQDPRERLALLNQYLENFKGTVFRQVMFAEFEKTAHEMAERGEALDPASLNALYAGLVRDYFGPVLTMDEEVQYEWARIPHFYRPFYVYKYATGYTSAVALSEAVRSGGPQAVSRYLEFLSMGGSADPLDELRHAGVDLASPAPVHAALQKFEKVLAQARELAAEI